MVLAWENLQEVFVMLVVVVVVFLTGGFSVSGLLFLATGIPPWLLRPVNASTSSEFYPGYFWLLYFLPGFFVTFSPRAIRFGWPFFTHGRFLLCAPSPHFWHVFVTQMRTGTHHPGSSSVPALRELSLPADTWTWTTHIVVTRPLIYQLRQWATKYKVKVELLNMFCLFKVVWKDYKHTFNKTW